jgi:hypothetical protein
MTGKGKRGKNHRQVRVRGKNGLVNYLSPGELTYQPIIQNVLDASVVSRIQWVFNELKPVIIIESPQDATLEQFEIMFMRSSEPELDVGIWETLVKAFYLSKQYFSKDTGLDTDCLIFRILFFHITDSLTEEEQQRDDIKIIKKVFDDIIKNI